LRVSFVVVVLRFLTLCVDCGVLLADDELIKAVIASLPKSACTTGVPTLAAVKARFHVVKEETRKAGLAPESAPPMLGQMIGNFLAMVSVQPSAPVNGEGIEAVLSRASASVACGDLSQALEEIDEIQVSASSIIYRISIRLPLFLHFCIALTSLLCLLLF
jgi:hypothetical protein